MYVIIHYGTFKVYLQFTMCKKENLLFYAGTVLTYFLAKTSSCILYSLIYTYTNIRYYIDVRVVLTISSTDWYEIK